VDSARKGDEVCVKIEAVPGEAPKMYGRHFDDSDLLISRVSQHFFRKAQKFITYGQEGRGKYFNWQNTVGIF
jgi:hypothetical protein